MGENRYYCKQNTYTSNASDDSSYTFPVAWITDTRKRKSRLGKHRFLQDLGNQNQDTESVCEEPVNCRGAGSPKSPKDRLSSALTPASGGSPTVDSNNDFNFTNLIDLNHRDSYSQPLGFHRDLNFPSRVLNFQDTSLHHTIEIKSGEPFDEISKFRNISGESPKIVAAEVVSDKSLSSSLSSFSAADSKSCSNVLPCEQQPLNLRESPKSEKNIAVAAAAKSTKPSVVTSVAAAAAAAVVTRITPAELPPFKNEERVNAFNVGPAVTAKQLEDFQFEAPLPVLPAPIPKTCQQWPPYITIKGKTYRVVNILGSGGSSMVYQVLHPENNDTLAVKRVVLSDVDESIAEGYIDEVKLLKNLQKSEFIIKMYDHELVCDGDKKLLHVVMEKGDIDLSELIRNINKTKKLSILMIVYYWHEMLSAVHDIHNEGIIHSDLKPANFLLVKGRLKLIDFGIASSIQGDMTSVYKDVFTGTLNYMSPEAVQFVRPNCSGGSMGYKITYKTDVWSLGCILYNLIYGRLPFQHIRKKWDKMRAIVDPEVQIDFPEVKGVPSVLMVALKSCLDKNPTKRMSVSQLLELPYCGN